MIRFIQKEYSLFSRCLRFFRELKTIEKLPISKEEFKIFILEPCLRFIGKSSGEKFNRIEDKLETYYGSDSMGEFFGKIGSSFLLTWAEEHGYSAKPDKLLANPKLQEGIDWTYNKILYLPKRYISKSIGLGMYGICFDYPFGRVEKISFRGFTPEEQKFYNYLLKNRNIDLFPTVYTLEKDQVIMEKLITDHPKIDELRKLTGKYITQKFVGKNGFDVFREVNIEKLEKDLNPSHWFVKLINTTRLELNKIFGKPIIGDFHAANFGIRPKTGELVYFDPIGGKMLMS